MNDALARKYDNDPADAARLVDLALLFDPTHNVAQHLQQELASAKPPELPPATSASADKKPSRPRADAKGDPRAAGRPAPQAAQPAQPAQAAGTGAAAAPAPTVRKTGDSPAPQSTGPWL